MPEIDTKPVSEAPVESKKRTYDEITNLYANDEEAKLHAKDSTKTASGVPESKRLKKEESSAPSNRPSTLLSESQIAEEARQRAIIVTNVDEAQET